MNKPHFKRIDSTGKLTIFHFENCIHVLCRSADWYGLSPIKRYLCNMAATIIRMEDAKTETREYTYERFNKLVYLLEIAVNDDSEAAMCARKLWRADGDSFGVVHLESENGKRGDLLLGDNPDDWHVFAMRCGRIAPDDSIDWSPRPIEGSDE